MKAFLFPGQGSQRKGMGGHLFAGYAEYVSKADEILGYSIEELCISDADNRLNFTAYTQPAIFVVSALYYLDSLKTTQRPDFAAGHSIGEYAALFAADAFDFETGLRIVQKRAELMSQAEGGALAAVVGLPRDAVEARMLASGLPGIEIANINSPTQIVVGAPAETIQEFARFSEGQEGRVIVLRVSGAFHTSYMRDAQAAFRAFLDTVDFREPAIPVMSNYTAEPHTRDQMATNLANHLANPVQWTRCIENMIQAGVDTFTEIGSKILTPMVNDIRDHMAKTAEFVPATPAAEAGTAVDSAFCAGLGLRKPMIVGGTDQAAAGAELVAILARDGILAFLDTEGVPMAAVEQALQSLGGMPDIAGKYGVSLTFDAAAAEADAAVIELCLRHGVRFIELRGYFEPSEAVLRYRREGGLDEQGRPRHRILLRTAEADTAASFLNISADAPGMRDLSLIDAVCVETRPWRSTATGDAGDYDRVLGMCRAYAGRRPFGRIFVGLSGHAVTQRPVEAALAQAADFALIGSAFLLAREARLDDTLKAALARVAEPDFRETADWRYPAFGTASFACVLNAQAAAQAQALRELYLNDALDAPALRRLDEAYAGEGSALSAAFIDACDGMSKFEFRAAVRARVCASSRPHILECEAPFPGLAAWLNERGASFPVSATALAGLIYST